MINPLISIILPVYNAQDYIKESIDSILNQTYKNFEFIIINDGSTDKSEEIILSFNDSRIKYFSQKNIGLAGTLNVGLNFATGIYIARQDQDDISHKDRLEKQIDYLEKNPSILLLGTRAKIFSNSQQDLRFHNHATHPAELKFDLLFDNPFVHSSVMFKKEIINEIGNYNTDKSFFEDYELWSRFSAKGSVANLKNVLVDYRHHEQGLSKSTTYFKSDARYNQSVLNIERLMGHKDKAFNELAALFHWEKEKCIGLSIKEIDSTLLNISNKIMTIYPNEEKIINERLIQYKKIFRHRLNVIERRKIKWNYIKLLILKVENKLLKLHPHIVNS
ncbi:MAG: glycosyltransferase [Bacteroidota bacterium]|nr:glycosyltransferase [Bacteroidota bacterium]